LPVYFFLRTRSSPSARRTYDRSESLSGWPRALEGVFEGIGGGIFVHELAAHRFDRQRKDSDDDDADADDDD
jgi:hypothetical protein